MSGVANFISGDTNIEPMVRNSNHPPLQNGRCALWTFYDRSTTAKYPNVQKRCSRVGWMRSNYLYCPDLFGTSAPENDIADSAEHALKLMPTLELGNCWCSAFKMVTSTQRLLDRYVMCARVNVFDACVCSGQGSAMRQLEIQMFQRLTSAQRTCLQKLNLHQEKSH